MAILQKKDFLKFKSDFEKLDEAEQWYIILVNKHLIDSIHYDEDMANVWLKGYLKPEHRMSFKSGGGHNPIEHLLEFLNIKSRLI